MVSFGIPGMVSTFAYHNIFASRHIASNFTQLLLAEKINIWMYSLHLYSADWVGLLYEEWINTFHGNELYWKVWEES